MQGIKLARFYTKNVGFTAKYAFQSNADFLCRIFGEVIQAGASTITLADTPGYALPEEVAYLIQYIREHTPGIDQAVIGVRCYNDLGLATANSLSAITNGAGQVEVTVNGIGKRAGNTSIEEVVMALESRSSIFCRTTLLHHQNATCGVSCGIIPLRRMPNTTPGAAALHLASCW